MKTKQLTKEYDLQNGRLLTLTAIAQDRLVARVNPEYKNLSMQEATEKEDYIIEEAQGTLLSVGWAIKNPTDDLSPTNLGETISAGRAVKKPIVQLALENSRMTETFMLGIMDNLFLEINTRFYSFIPLSNGDKTAPKEQKKKSHWDLKTVTDRTEVHLERAYSET